MHEYNIVPNKGHYDVYIDGIFYCTSDTWSEAVREVEDHREMCIKVN